MIYVFYGAASLNSAAVAQVLAASLPEDPKLVPVVFPADVDRLTINSDDVVYLIDCPLSTTQLYHGKFYSAHEVHAVCHSSLDVLEQVALAKNEIPARLNLVIVDQSQSLYEVVSTRFNCRVLDPVLERALHAYHFNKDPVNGTDHLLLGYVSNGLLKGLCQTDGWSRRVGEYMAVESALPLCTGSAVEHSELIISNDEWSRLTGVAYCAPSLLSLELTAVALSTQVGKDAPLCVAWRPIAGRMIVASAVGLNHKLPYVHNMLSVALHGNKKVHTWAITARDFFTHWVR